jgi:hypothetical protein
MQLRGRIPVRSPIPACLRVLKPGQQSFPGFAYGYVYGTDSQKRRTIAIPYNYGVTKLESVNDLYVHAWVPVTGPANVADMSVGHLIVKTMPNSCVPLKFQYSIFYVPQEEGREDYVNGCCALLTKKPWRGNILVVKRGKRKAAINMEREDAFLVDTLVSKCVAFLRNFNFSHPASSAASNMGCLLIETESLYATRTHLTFSLQLQFFSRFSNRSLVY